jgi:hypothetical protein
MRPLREEPLAMGVPVGLGEGGAGILGSEGNHPLATGKREDKHVRDA